ncbi:MAG: LytTR family DNA-binding domain-containing protein [Bacteroidota bacterium]
MKCLIIDDEPLAREGLKQYLEDIDFLELIGMCENPLEALPFLEKETIDLLFLDIQMPKLNGLDFLKSLQNPPLVIITTAFPSFALEGFQLNVLDYLVKPITFQRFFKAINKAKSQHELLSKSVAPAASGNDYFFVKCSQQYEKILLSELLFVVAMQNYVHLHTLRGKFTTLLPLKNLSKELPETHFIQTHKSYIVSINKVETLEGNMLRIGSNQIPISRSYREEVEKRILGGRLLRK